MAAGSRQSGLQPGKARRPGGPQEGFRGRKTGQLHGGGHHRLPPHRQEARCGLPVGGRGHLCGQPDQSPTAGVLSSAPAGTGGPAVDLASPAWAGRAPLQGPSLVSERGGSPAGRGLRRSLLPARPRFPEGQFLHCPQSSPCTWLRRPPASVSRPGSPACPSGVPSMLRSPCHCGGVCRLSHQLRKPKRSGKL